MHLFGYFYATGPDLFTSGQIGLGRPTAGRGLRPLLTQLATPILTSKRGLGDESGPDIRWWEKKSYYPWLG
jgi:hypothetical protein